MVGDFLKESREIMFGELPLEWFCDCLPVELEVEDAFGGGVEVWEVVRP